MSREIKLFICYNKDIWNAKIVVIKQKIKNLSQIILDLVVGLSKNPTKNVDTAKSINQRGNHQKKDYFVGINVIHCGEVKIVKVKKLQTIKMENVTKGNFYELVLGIRNGVERFSKEIITRVLNVMIKKVEIWRQTTLNLLHFTQDLDLLQVTGERFARSVIN